MLRGPLVPRTDRDRRVRHGPHAAAAPAARQGAGAGHFASRTPSASADRRSSSSLLLAASGLLLTLVYQPAPGAAYDSVLAIERDGPVRPARPGRPLLERATCSSSSRSLHAARVFLTGGFHGPRQFNWVVGVGLLLARARQRLHRVSAAVGPAVLLGRDDLHRHARLRAGDRGDALQRVARGGRDIGSDDARRVLHAAHLGRAGALLVFALAFHFWRVRKAGGVVVPPPRTGTRARGARTTRCCSCRTCWCARRSLALVIIAVVVVLAAALRAPARRPREPGHEPEPAKAPWYFMGLQELLVHLHPGGGRLVVPLLGAGGTAAAFLT